MDQIFVGKRANNNYERVKSTRPTDHERDVLWPGRIFVDDEYDKTNLVYRVHQVVIDDKLEAPDIWQLMYYDVELSHTQYDDGAPCDCKDGRGGSQCKMDASTIKQVVEWLQKFAHKCPKELKHVPMES